MCVSQFGAQTQPEVNTCAGSGTLMSDQPASPILRPQNEASLCCVSACGPTSRPDFPAMVTAGRPVAARRGRDVVLWAHRTRPQWRAPGVRELSVHRPVLSSVARADVSMPEMDGRALRLQRAHAGSGPGRPKAAPAAGSVAPTRRSRALPRPGPIGGCRRRCGHHGRPVHPAGRGAHRVIGFCVPPPGEYAIQCL